MSFKTLFDAYDNFHKDIIYIKNNLLDINKENFIEFLELFLFSQTNKILFDKCDLFYNETDINNYYNGLIWCINMYYLGLCPNINYVCKVPIIYPIHLWQFLVLN